MKTLLTADHGGYHQAKYLASFLRSKGHDIVTQLSTRPSATDDYPVIVKRAIAVMKRENITRAIMICRTGVGMAMAANKYPGIRAVQGLTRPIVERSRLEEDANVLTLAADYTPLTTMCRYARRWLTTPFSRQIRYGRRVKMLNSAHHAS